ncbi:MAG: ATP-binding cassette domain-containing protein [Candidatus Eisenbacteria sp.]|nr:ATP-binding cassette domain-containing protein [Candidatus Eisenbacteria bacterium]
MISFYDVGKAYRTGTVAVERASFRIGRNEFVFLVGPSGAGKSTVLKLIYMEEFPTAGRVVVGKIASDRVKPRQIPHLRRKLGVVYQDFRLLKDWTAYENVAIALRVTGASRKRLKKRTLASLARVGLVHKSGERAWQLSGGEQQRLAIARAIANEPILVLADEPTGNLDPETSLGIFHLLRDIHLAGTAVLVATHDAEMVKRFAGRVIRIDGGKLSEDI